MRAEGRRGQRPTLQGWVRVPCVRAHTSGHLVRAHVPELDGLRALAVAGVVLTHAAFLTGATSTWGFVGGLMGRGDFGVALFFSLSGYLLHLHLRQEMATGSLRLGAYFVRRATRILPAYWACLVFVAAVFGPETRAVGFHAVLAQIYVPDAIIDEFSQSWSVATEAAFYAVLPFAVMALEPLRRRRPELPALVLAGVVVSGVILAAAVGAQTIGQDVLFERWMPARLSNFALGMLLAEVVLHRRGRMSDILTTLAESPGPLGAVGAASYVLATTPAAGLLTLGTTTGLQLGVKMALSTVVSAALLLPLVLGGSNGLRRALGQPLPRWLGLVSYGIFLWHVPVFYALYAVFNVPFFSGGLLTLLSLGVPLTVAVAAVSYYAIERPAMSWAARRVRRGRQRRDTGPT